MTIPNPSMFDVARFKMSTDDYTIRVEDTGALHVYVSPAFAAEFIRWAIDSSAPAESTMRVMQEALAVAAAVTE